MRVLVVDDEPLARGRLAALLGECAGVEVVGSVADGEADTETTERVRRRLKDLEFIDRLEQIRMQPATWVEGKFDNAGADRDYARAFRDYGVDVERLSVEEAVGRLKARPALAIPLTAALDDWVYARHKVANQDVAGWKRLVAVACGIDPETIVFNHLNQPRELVKARPVSALFS